MLASQVSDEERRKAAHPMTRLYIEPEAEAELEEAAVRCEDAVAPLGQDFIAVMVQRQVHEDCDHTWATVWPAIVSLFPHRSAISPSLVFGSFHPHPVFVPQPGP